MRDPIQASKIEARPVDWLWQDRIPKGMITIVAGRPDQGKGLFAAHLAAEVSRRGMNVLYSAMEDDPATMTKPRLEAAKADLDRILVWRFQLPSQQSSMEKKIRENKIRLVVIDPLSAHLHGGISRGSDSIRVLTNPLSEFAEATGVTFLIIEHALKRVPKYANPLTGIAGGSSGLPSAARMAFLFGTDPKDADKKLLAPVKSNLREKPLSIQFEVDTMDTDEVENVAFLVQQEEVEFDPGDLLHGNKDAKPGRAPEKRTQAGEWLARTLFNHGGAGKAKPMKAGLVFEDGLQFGLTRKTIRNASEDIGVVKNPPGGGRNCQWSLDDVMKKAMRLAAKKGKK